jgi:lipopolysaccharide biosynthesis protein
MSHADDVRAIAFYLPQFHRVPENDEWWGRGFTEWQKVAAARPLFIGHQQPHVPADLGFYDLRVPEARAEQAHLARDHGISGFCYWHYWFQGRRLLERPFEEVLASGEPDFPFCLCWVNENWTRRWDGHDEEILVEQGYSPEDDLAHIRWLATAFRDPRYIRVDGKPLLLVYRAARLPDPRRTAALWREEAMRLGVGELHLARVESFPEEAGDPALAGFDAAVEFQPDWNNLSKDLCVGPVALAAPDGRPTALSRGWDGDNIAAVYDYGAVVEKMLAKPAPPYLRYACVAPSWDNSARRGSLDNSVILANSTPELYEGWLRGAIDRLTSQGGPGLLFVNAWNEWAEGNHLEPDLRFGRGYLEATRRVLRP